MGNGGSFPIKISLGKEMFNTNLVYVSVARAITISVHCEGVVPEKLVIILNNPDEILIYFLDTTSLWGTYKGTIASDEEAFRREI